MVVEDIKDSAPNTTATAHYIFPEPRPISDEPGAEKVDRMRFEIEVDCAHGTSGDRLQETTTADGQVLSRRVPHVVLTHPKPDSIGASLVSSVCDPDVRSANTVRRSLRTIEREYRRRQARS